MASIELSKIVIEGLQSLNTVDLASKLITNAVKMSLYSESSKTRTLCIPLHHLRL